MAYVSQHRFKQEMVTVNEKLDKLLKLSTSKQKTSTKEVEK